MYSPDFLEDLRRGAASLIDAWDLSPRTEVTLLNISENATFRADDPTRRAPVILRVHRPHYHTRDEIASELAWIDAVRRDAVARIARPLPMRSGALIADVEVAGEIRHVVAFEFMPGAEPRPSDDLRAGFAELGAISARLHAHARAWTRPPGFTRKTWDFAATVGPDAFWGDWRAAMGLTQEGRATLECVVDLLERRLAAFGTRPDRFGLIHADLRLANLLIDGDRIGVIDFDDCGFGWYAFDFAAAISFFETDPSIPALQAAWLDGYRRVAPFDPIVEAELPTFIMLRRLQLTAWIASHRETPTAQELGAGYTDGAVEMGAGYLRDMGPPAKRLSDH